MASQVTVTDFSTFPQIKKTKVSDFAQVLSGALFFYIRERTSLQLLELRANNLQ